MVTVPELTALYGNFMLGPRPGAGVCDSCFDLIEPDDTRCYRCARNGGWLDAAVPISYSVAHEQLHLALAAYKRQPRAVAGRFQIELAAVLWRYLAQHEDCLARAADVPGFELVTAVPSGAERDQEHPLHHMLGTLIGPTRDRYSRLLERSQTALQPREFSTSKFIPTRELSGQTVLLIDDMWTTGSSAWSAAATLKQAGAAAVAMVVIGRYLHRDWGQNDRRLGRLSQPFEWSRCALEPGGPPGR